LKLDRNEPFRREDFIASEAAAPALAMLDAWPHWRGGTVALVGPAGSGKTHLASAWAEQVGARVLTGSRWNLASLDEFAGQPMLLENADRGGMEELLFHLINMAAHPGGSLLLTARTPPAAWPTDRLPDLRSRLNALPVAALDEPDDDLLAALLGKFFRERNIKPPEDLLTYLVWRIERSAVRAHEIVRLLDEKADAERRPVSRALAREILEQEAHTDEAAD
jgi:chromosomal replication initiation ATPase DnaA